MRYISLVVYWFLLLWVWFYVWLICFRDFGIYDNPALINHTDKLFKMATLLTVVTVSKDTLVRLNKNPKEDV